MERGWRVYETNRRPEQLSRAATRITTMQYRETAIIHTSIPNTCKFCTTARMQEGIQITGKEDIQDNSLRSISESTTLQNITKGHKSKWIVTKGHTNWPHDNGKEIAEVITKDTLLTVSDGSHFGMWHMSLDNSR